MVYRRLFLLSPRFLKNLLFIKYKYFLIMTQFDLNTQNGRVAALDNLDVQLLEGLKEIVPLAPNADAYFTGGNTITLTLWDGSKRIFQADVDISYNKSFSEWNINFGSTGKFNPENKIAYWRTMHAATLLKSWKDVCIYCDNMRDKYLALINEIDAVTKTTTNAKQ